MMNVTIIIVLLTPYVNVSKKGMVVNLFPRSHFPLIGRPHRYGYQNHYVGTQGGLRITNHE